MVGAFDSLSLAIVSGTPGELSVERSRSGQSWSGSKKGDGTASGGSLGEQLDSRFGQILNLSYFNENVLRALPLKIKRRWSGSSGRLQHDGEMWPFSLGLKPFYCSI